MSVSEIMSLIAAAGVARKGLIRVIIALDRLTAIVTGSRARAQNHDPQDELEPVRWHIDASRQSKQACIVMKNISSLIFVQKFQKLDRDFTELCDSQ